MLSLSRWRRSLFHSTPPDNTLFWRRQLLAEARKVAYNDGQWVHKRIPVRITPSSSAHMPSGNSMSTVCRVLFEEEQHAFRQAVNEATDR